MDVRRSSGELPHSGGPHRENQVALACQPARSLVRPLARVARYNQSTVRHPGVLFLLLACPVCVPCQQIGPRDVPPTVVGIVGDWSGQTKFAKTALPLGFGSEVSSDYTIIGSTRGGSILITSRSGNRSYRFFQRCEKLPCKYLFKDENKPVEDPSFWARLGEAVMPLIRGHGEVYIAAVSRDWGQELREAVVRLEGGEADISPALSGLDTGPYYLRLQPMGSPVPVGNVAALTWTPGSPAKVPAAGAAPGLYKLVLTNAVGEPSGTESWILLAAPPLYARLSGEFEQAVQATAGWAREMDPDAARPILRAYLRSLAADLR